MIAPENPPGFLVCTEAQKAAWDQGFRIEFRSQDGWLRYGSTTARGEIWIAGVPKRGPWFLSLGDPGAAAEFGPAPPSDIAGPGMITFMFAELSDLHRAVDRAYRLGVSLPDTPLQQFQAVTKQLPKATEVERLVVQRIGQNLFRSALLSYWDGRCPLTGITDPALLRASHIVAWTDCETDALRLDVHNGLLLSALWDAAFDAGLLSFADDGSVLTSSKLSPHAAASLQLEKFSHLMELTDAHRVNLAHHRVKYGY